MIAVVGHTAIDHISRVVSFPPPNGSTTILDRKVYLGGGAANIAAGIATLGESCTLVSAVGPDFEGSEYDRWMKRLGIRQQFFVDQEANTPTAFMFTDPAGDQITFFEWGASRQFARSDAPSFPFVHLATADPGFNVRVAENSEFTSFDPGQDLHRYTASDLYSIMRNTSLLFANEHEVEGMCRTMDISRETLTGMVPMALFTMSSRGSTLHHEGESHFIPAIPVTCADPTGAGDSYRAGFLSAYRKGLPPVECARVGTVTASFVVEKAGCQTNLPGWEDMKARYENYFGRFDY
jgi:sugar/nucleoside kinase (ribokinase family)